MPFKQIKIDHQSNLILIMNKSVIVNKLLSSQIQKLKVF